MPGDDMTEQSLVPRSSAPQIWTATVAEPKFYWYDLLVGGGPLPDFRDPTGRYLRRLQFALDGTMEKRLIYFVISRPRVRIDTKRQVSWGFFSLKLTIPVLVGPEEKKNTISVDLEVPFEATYKKPVVALEEQFLTLNWGSMIETYSIHDLIQKYDTGLKMQSKVLYVGQTRDPAARLAKGSHPVVNALHDANHENDTFLLVTRFKVAVDTAARDMSEEASVRTQMDVLEAALIRYFEGPSPRLRSDVENGVRRERMENLQDTYYIERVTVDLGFKQADSFFDMFSDHVEKSRRHLFECVFDNGHAVVKRLSESARPLISLDA
ncbi:hypothetical protein [Massilia endophytica]|uniref:hypothetical protein n=1 Tax=Massilia endophytica TaxID=2899220 RepID=UPI001E34B56C|nr:hypothetical protein [Massilia endophytica]UGQ47546.1 hypothetical protein LSQ66_03425 [Massilia endophytica]